MAQNLKKMTLAGALLKQPGEVKQKVQQAAQQVVEQSQKATAQPVTQPPSSELLDAALQKQQQGSARQKQQDVQRELDAYKSSAVYENNQRKRNREALQKALEMTFAVPGSVSDRPMNVVQVQPKADVYEEQLKEQVKQYQAQATMEEDMAQLEGWSEADRAALDSYIIGRDQRDAFTLNPMTDNGFVPQLPANAQQLISKYGQKRVDELAESLTRSRNAEVTQQVAQDAREAVNNGAGAAVGHNAASVPVMAVGGLTGLMGYLQELGRASGRYPTMDPNNAGNLLNVYGSNVRSQTAQNIAGDQYDENGQKVADGGTMRQILSYGYQGIMGVADTYARMVLGGGAAGGATLAATNTFAQTMSEASAQGATPGQAAVLAVTKAGIEALSEKIPLDELVKTAKGGKQVAMQAAKNALAQAGIEAATEEISLLGSILAETAILQEKSSYKDKTAEELLLEAAETAIVSGISGGMSSAGASIAANLTPQQRVEAAMEKTAAQLAQEVPKVEQKQKTEVDQRLDRALDEARGIEQKNTALEGGRKYQLREYSQRERENWKNSKRIVLYEGVEHFRQFIQNALTGKTQTNKKLYFGAVDSDFAEAIANATGVNVEGYNLSLGENEIRKINKGHGNENREAMRGQRAVTEDDYLRIPEVVQSADSIALSQKTYEGKPVIEFRKKDGNEITTVAAVVSDKRLDLFVQTAFINKKSGSIATPEPVQADSFTPKATGGTAPGAELTPAGELPNNGSPATPISSASVNGIPQTEAVVNAGAKKSGDVTQAPAEGLSANHETNARSALASLSPDYRIAEGGENVNGDFDEGRVQGADTLGASTEGEQGGIKGTGAAERNFAGTAEYDDLLTDDNVQRSRPNDVRPMKVPKTDGYGRRVSEAVGNAYGAEITSDRMAGEIEQLIQEGALGFDRRSNRESLENAYDAIYGTEAKQGKGEAGTLRAIRQNVYNGKVQDGDIEKAMLLYAKHAGKEGKRSQEYSAELMVDLATMANMTGRNLQLFKLLRRMTPEGQLMAIQKNVGRYVDSLNEGRSRRKQVQTEIPQELENDFLDATTETEQEAAMDAIYKNAAAQIEPTLGEKWDAWRNLAMLGNVKTHIRNAAGSAAFRPYVSVKRTIGAALESLTLEQQNRTKAVLGPGEESKGLLSWAKEDARTKAAMDAMDFSGTTGNEARNAIEDARRILPGKLDDLRKQNMEWMEGADMEFKQREYAYSLASFLKARGYSVADIQNVPQKVLQEGRQLAVKEAQKATFNDRNSFSDAMSKLRVKGNSPWSKALNAAAKGLMPFTRTPANILVRAKEYSPIELARGFDTMVRKVKNGEATIAEGIDQLASGVTGTGAMLLGTALAAGLIPGVRLVGKIEDEDELREGAQEYSLQVGDTYYGISWLAPANIPLFIGANLYNSLTSGEEAGELDAWDYISGLAETCSDILDPMLELSCLSSLADAVENASYEDSGGDMLLSMLASAATSYFTQGLPTLSGQAEQATEVTKSSVYSSGDNTIQRAFERTVGNATKRIPGIDLYQTEKLDEFGNPVQNNSNAFVRTLDAFFNPFTVSKAKNDQLTTEISRLHEVQPEKVSPPDTPKSISYTDVNGERRTGYHLTADEFSTLAEVQGQTAKEILEEIIQGDTYAAMTDAQKASVFDYVYDYAREKGRTEALAGYQGMTGWMQGIEGGEADAILNKAITGAFVDAFDMLDAEPEKAAEALEQAYNLVGDSVDRANFTNAAAGRVKYFMEAKKSGVDAATFGQLYQQFRSIDADPNLDAGGKAQEWAYQLEKAQEAGTITKAQKEKLKESMVYYQMFPAETEKFDQMTENGISADDALDIGKLLEGIKPQEGYANVRNVQKASAIAGSDLSAAEKTEVMKIYLSDAQDENLDLMLALGYSAEDYAAAYEVTANISGKNKIIHGLADELGLDWATAQQLYHIFK